MTFCYQAMDASGRAVRDVIQANSQDEAARVLRSKGLLVTRLAESSDITGTTEPSRSAHLTPTRSHRKTVRWKEVVYFTQQMSMLLSSGARIVSALNALEAQSRSEGMRNLIHSLRGRVEDGVPLSAAMADYPDIFDGVYRSVTASGESTGRMAEAFDQIAGYTRRRQEVRQKLVGAMIYPILLVFMCIGVMAGMFGFVLPRFRDLFNTLDAPLPGSTRFMMTMSDQVRGHWMLMIGSVVAVIVCSVLLFRSSTGQRWWAGVFTNIPIVSGLIRRVILAKLFRVWGVLVANNVGLMDALRLARGVTRSTAFHKLIDNVEESVTQGRRVGEALHESPLVLPTLAAAIITGEESGRLGASLLFVADALESENSQIIGSLSRIIEPIILIVMGTIVGFVAISLFMPMFDVATLTGGG